MQERDHDRLDADRRSRARRLGLLLAVVVAALLALPFVLRVV